MDARKASRTPTGALSVFTPILMRDAKREMFLPRILVIFVEICPVDTFRL